jgi:hypothetical protein
MSTSESSVKKPSPVKQVSETSTGSQKNDKLPIMKEPSTPPHESTITGLHEWYKHLFTHLGWMILCKDNFPDKIKVYVESIIMLEKALNARASDQTTSPSDQKDLHVMANNVKTLRKHAAEDFASVLGEELTKIAQKGGKGKKKKSKSKSKSKSKGKKSKSKDKKHKKSKSKSKSKGKKAKKASAEKW